MRVQCACLDFIEGARHCGGDMNAGVVLSRKQEEHKLRGEKLELNVFMSAREGGRKESEAY